MAYFNSLEYETEAEKSLPRYLKQNMRKSRNF